MTTTCKPKRFAKNQEHSCIKLSSIVCFECSWKIKEKIKNAKIAISSVKKCEKCYEKYKTPTLVVEQFLKSTDQNDIFEIIFCRSWIRNYSNNVARNIRQEPSTYSHDYVSDRYSENCERRFFSHTATDGKAKETVHICGNVSS